MDLKAVILDAVHNVQPAQLLPPDLPTATRAIVLGAWPMASAYIERALQPVSAEQLEQFARSLAQKAGEAAGLRITIEPLSPPELLPPGTLDPRD